MDERDFEKFELMMRFGRISYISQIFGNVMHLNKQLNKQPICRWFETQLSPIWSYGNDNSVGNKLLG